MTYETIEWVSNLFPDYNIIVEFDRIDKPNPTIEVHNQSTQQLCTCLFCQTPFDKWSKKDVAHAISECLGNKSLINYSECYDCNHLFGELAENHLGKYIMPYRFINDVFGKSKKKSNVIKDYPGTDTSAKINTYRFESKSNGSIFESDTFDVSKIVLNTNGNERVSFPNTNELRISIPRQKYDPRYVYVSLLKMAYTLLPTEEYKNCAKNILLLYYSISPRPLFNEAKISNETEREHYLNGLPNIGVEACITDAPLNFESCVNVCLLKLKELDNTKPTYLFAIQLKWHTIIIPVLSDSNISSSKIQFSFKIQVPTTINIRPLSFSDIEQDYIIHMKALSQYELSKEEIEKLESDLLNAEYLKNNRD